MGKRDRIAQLEHELAELREMNLALGHVLRHCPPRSTNIGRQRDLVLKRHDRYTQQRADAEAGIVA